MEAALWGAGEFFPFTESMCKDSRSETEMGLIPTPRRFAIYNPFSGRNQKLTDPCYAKTQPRGAPCGFSRLWGRSWAKHADTPWCLSWSNHTETQLSIKVQPTPLADTLRRY